MKLKIEINMDNAAFDEPGTGLETGRILRKLAEHCESADWGSYSGCVLHDSNGNRVGKAEVDG